MSKRLFFLWIFGFLATSNVGYTQSTAAPSLVNFQGRVAGASPTALTDGNYKVSINIYESQLAEEPVWGPQLFDGIPGVGHGSLVPVVGGFFNVILGPKDTLDRDINTAFALSDAHIGIAIWQDGDIAPPELSPRQQVLSSPYALSAQYSLGSVPIGGVIMFMGTEEDVDAATASGVWRLLDGSALDDPESPLSFPGDLLPDMTSSFAKGAPKGGTMATGGSETHSHGVGSYDPEIGKTGIRMQTWLQCCGSYTGVGRQATGGVGGSVPNAHVTLGARRVDNSSSQPGSSTRLEGHGHDREDNTLVGTSGVSSSEPAFVTVNYLIRVK